MQYPLNTTINTQFPRCSQHKDQPAEFFRYYTHNSHIFQCSNHAKNDFSFPLNLNTLQSQITTLEVFFNQLLYVIVSEFNAYRDQVYDSIEQLYHFIQSVHQKHPKIDPKDLKIDALTLHGVFTDSDVVKTGRILRLISNNVVKAYKRAESIPINPEIISKLSTVSTNNESLDQSDVKVPQTSKQFIKLQNTQKVASNLKGIKCKVKNIKNSQSISPNSP